MDEERPGGFGSCTFTFKKSMRRAQNTRKREEVKKSDSSSSGSDSDTKIVRLEKKPRRANPMVQGKVSTKQRSNKNYSSSEDEAEKARSRVSVFYDSTKTAERDGPQDMGATATLEIETEKDKDAQSIYQKSLEINKELKGKAEDGIYRGMANYKVYYDKKDTVMGNAGSGMNRKGPIRAPENIRSTVRWDYQPDICKDYKETGFCGFGDSCKFLHDRSDYKFGWQIEKEVAEGRYFKEDDETERYEIPDDEEELPFKCLLCRQSFVSPVVTKCKHYFCEKCALDHYKKSQRCYVCRAQTNGVFNPAKNISARLAKEAADKKANEEEGGGEGIEVPEEEESSGVEDSD